MVEVKATLLGLVAVSEEATVGLVALLEVAADLMVIASGEGGR